MMLRQRMAQRYCGPSTFGSESLVTTSRSTAAHSKKDGPPFLARHLVVLSTRGSKGCLQLLPWWVEDVGLATWGLVIVGLCGTAAAAWTLITIRRQTNAIEQQVREMRKTAPPERHSHFPRRFRSSSTVNPGLT